MKKIYKKTIRDLKLLKWNAFLISLTIGSGIAIYAGGFMARDSLFNTRDTYYRELNLADLEINFTPLSEDELPKVEKLNFVEKIEKRFITPASLETHTGKPLTSMVVYLDPIRLPEVNQLQIIQGTYLSPEDPTGVVIERTLAEIHGYKVGDEITLNPYSFPQKVKIRGIAISPEFLIATSEPDTFILNKGSLGVVFASQRLIEEFFGYPLYNDLLIQYSTGERRAKEAITASLAENVPLGKFPLEIKRIVTREGQFAYRFLEQNLKGFSIFIPAIVMVFCIVTIIVTLISMNRLIRSQTREIGAFTAIGYSKLQVFRSYLLLALLIGLAGSLMGMPLSFLIRNFLCVSYADTLGLPSPQFVTSSHFLVIGFLLGIVISIASAMIPLWGVLTLLPSQALRGLKEETFSGFPKPVEKVIEFLSVGHTSRKFGFRNIFRRPKLSLAIILFVALATSVSTAFLVSNSSMTHYAKSTFSKEQWDAIVNFEGDIYEEDFRNIVSLEGIGAYQPFVQGYAALSAAGMDYVLDYNLAGISPHKPIRGFQMVEGTLFESTDAMEIILNKNFSDLPLLHIGDPVHVWTTHGEYDLKVRGVMSDATFGWAFVPIDTARKMLGLEGRSSGFLATFSGPSDPVTKELLSHEEVTKVRLKNDMERLVEEFQEQTRALLNVAVGISIFIAILFILSSMILNLREREGEYACFRSLGLGESMLATILLIELITLGLISIFASLPSSFVFSKYLNEGMSKAWFEVVLFLNISDFLKVIIVILILLPSIAFFGLWHIHKLDIPTIVGKRGFG